MGFNIKLASHNINHTSCKNVIEPNFPKLGNKNRYVSKTLKELATIFARFINQYNFKYQLIFSARFDKQDEDKQVLHQTEFFKKLNINQNLTESDIDITDVISSLEHQVQNGETKDNGWRFHQISSRTIYFYKTTEMNASKFLKSPLRSSAILNIEKN